MGTRGRQEHRQIRVEDLKIVQNTNGQPKPTKVNLRKDHDLLLRKPSTLVDKDAQWLPSSSYSQNAHNL